MKTLIEAIKNLITQALAIYGPMVEDICARKSVSREEVENLLNWLVSICISDEMLELFKKVCRKLYNQYPELITDYVLLYKEMDGII